MKKSFFSCCLTFAAMLAFSISTLAQHAAAGGQQERVPALRVVRPPALVLAIADAQAVLALPE